MESALIVVRKLLLNDVKKVVPAPGTLPLLPLPLLKRPGDDANLGIGLALRGVSGEFEGL